MDEKREKRKEEAMLTEKTPLLKDPPSPIERDVKWKMARTKRYGFVPHGRDDILNTAIERPEHPGCVFVAASGMTISRYYGRTSCGSSSSFTSITQQQLADIIGSLKNEIIGNLKEEVRNEIEEENKRSLEKLKQEFMEKWSSSLGHGSVNGFLEPQSIHHAKDRHAKCEHYIQTWVKESQQQVYLGAYLNHAMKTVKNIVDAKNDQGTPKWIEVKSHVQSGGYECGYYVMHWMWNIVSGGLKDNWSMWFVDGTTLDMETITTICKKWEAY
ncbi:hypothetical protein HKD37_03G007405 [Glycine soja]